jgi:hypothetical protein
MIAMRAPEGACSISVGHTKYQVQNGRVEVDPSHVADLLPSGFTLLDGQNAEVLMRQDPQAAIAKANASYPLVTMEAPEGAVSATIEGVLYKVGDDGLVVIPENAAPHLLPAGFKRVEATPVAVSVQVSPAPDAPPVDADGLRTDGPTPEEYVAAGYLAENYPPQGYAAKPSTAPPPAPEVALEDMNVFQLLKVLRDRGGDTSKPNDKVTLLNRIAALPPQ